MEIVSSNFLDFGSIESIPDRFNSGRRSRIVEESSSQINTIGTSLFSHTTAYQNSDHITELCI
ncbi:hypothetical protein LR48_Vigan01g255700 [Vigna angularis]|uniref:Uncharacterized protein n=1 Tax=Phaseolus angularis TaxID=3914 RepID=A0A0L9TR93_PHAAN|nr:hypothetical protein LR48_Vigan01g255700 [Vigna angularis]